MSKFRYTNPEAKSVFKWFGLLSLCTLGFALVSIVYHGLTKPSIVPDSDLILMLFGIVFFTLGVALANSYEIKELKGGKSNFV